jgi:hypothetical protein
LNGNQQDFEISKMLPDWTVDAFFSEIEKMFNVGFFVDKQNKTVSILFKKDFYQDAPKTFITQIQDSFTKNIDNEKREDYSIANVGYNIPSDEYFDLQNLPEEIIKKARKMTFPTDNEAIGYIQQESDKESLKDILFYGEDKNSYRICYEDKEKEAGLYRPKRVNVFSPLFNNPNSSEIDIELKIIPAPMRVIDLPVIRGFVVDPVYYVRTQMPAVKIVGYTEEESLDIQAEIEGTSKKEKYSMDNIQLFFYKGKVMIYETGQSIHPNRKLMYDMAFVDYLLEFSSAMGNTYADTSRVSLRLNDDNSGLKSLYQSSIKIDTTNEFTFYFIHKGQLDVKSIFVINNKEFVCKELQYNINAQGITPVIEGKFYPVD